MRKKHLKASAFLLAAILMMSSTTAYADVILAEYPGATENTAQSGNSNTGNSMQIGPGAGTSEISPSASAENSAVSDSSVSAGNGQSISIDPNIKQPEIASEAAVLMDAESGQVLYSKNADKQLYPASITKLMTALLTAENAGLDETVTYRASAVENLESGAANVQLSEGDTMSVKDSLYALLLKSACEVANGLAEHISGTQEAFALKMNERAKELGCKNTNFTNASGLNDTTHVTTAYDMALITRAAMANETVRTIASTLSYELPAVQKRGTLTVYNGHKMLNPANEQYYSGIVGGKTGYTSKAGNTLATEVTRDDKTLIAVVMKSSSKHYNDTKALFDYGFEVLAASGNTGTADGTSSSLSEGWKQEGTEWCYIKTDGSRAQSEWIESDGKSYYIDSEGHMITGWQKFSNGAYYYFDETSGAMLQNSWKNEETSSGIKSYYLQADGTMAVNKVVETKQGTYRVDENGVAVEKIG